MTKSTGKRKTHASFSRIIDELLAEEKTELDKHKELVMLSYARIEALIDVQEQVALASIPTIKKKEPQK